jgi:hypothetical protein
MEENKKPSNPPVHPTTWDSSYNSVMQTENGMTLRDNFAGLAMQGMIQDSALRELFANKGNIKDVSWMDIMAENAFFIADSMLKQREQ